MMQSQTPLYITAGRFYKFSLSGFGSVRITTCGDINSRINYNQLFTDLENFNGLCINVEGDDLKSIYF